MRERILAEQRAAAAYLAEHPKDRGARQWMEDWFAEEVLQMADVIDSDEISPKIVVGDSSASRP